MPEPDFNTWTVIFLIVALNGFFLAYIIISNKKGNKNSNTYLSALIILFSFTLLYYVAFWTNSLQFLPGFSRIILNFTFLFGPVIFLYFKSLKKEVTLFHNILHFLPFLFISLYQFPVFFNINSSWITDYHEFYYALNSNLFIKVFQNIHLAVYSILLFLFIKDKKGDYNNSFLKKMAWFFAGFTLSFLSYYILVATNTLRVEYDYMVSFSMTIFIYFIGYSGFRYPVIFQGTHKKNEKYERSGLTAQAMEHFAERLQEVMKHQKPFINKDLRLQELADTINISPHHLSHVINGKFNLNFSDFVNSYRIREAKRLLTHPDYKTTKIIHIAYEVGFNTKVSFNQTFKKFTGESPSEFRKNAAGSKSTIPH